MILLFENMDDVRKRKAQKVFTLHKRFSEIFKNLKNSGKTLEEVAH